jgi:RNA recognition motif-containing protein
VVTTSERGPASEKEENVPKSLYVGGLPYSTTEEGIRELFSGAGDVSAIRLITDRDTGQSRGFAFVEMADDDGAERAINMFNGHQFGGRTLVVNEARPRDDRGGGGGYRGGGGGYRSRDDRGDRRY